MGPFQKVVHYKGNRVPFWDILSSGLDKRSELQYDHRVDLLSFPPELTGPGQLLGLNQLVRYSVVD